MRRVVVTGLGLVTPLGADVEARRAEVRAALASWRRKGAESMVVVVVGEEEVRGRLGRRTVHVRR